MVFYMNKFKFSKAARIIILFIFIINGSLTMTLLLSVGILDPYFNFRKLDVTKQ